MSEKCPICGLGEMVDTGESPSCIDGKVYQCTLCNDRMNHRHLFGIRATRDAAIAKAVRPWREALAPFAQPEFSRQTSGMVQGDDSPVWSVNDAVLYLRDFRRVRALLDKAGA